MIIFKPALTPRERLGSDSSIMRKRCKPKTARRRTGSLSHLSSSPTGQRKITDLFKAQMKDTTEGEGNICKKSPKELTE